MRLTETSEALHKLHLFPVTTLETQVLHTRHWQEVRRILRKEVKNLYTQVSDLITTKHSERVEKKEN